MLPWWAVVPFAKQGVGGYEQSPNMLDNTSIGYARQFAFHELAQFFGVDLHSNLRLGPSVDRTKWQRNQVDPGGSLFIARQKCHAKSAGLRL